MNQGLEELFQKRSVWVRSSQENNFEEGIKRLLTELYPDNAHFIYELLQNAEDTEATKVTFILESNRLIFEHNGKRLFNISDVDSITSIGVSTKRDDPTSIGKFGVGFKAVFAYTNTPEIQSGSYHFTIHDLVVPVPATIGNNTNGNTRFIFPFDHTKKPAHQAVSEIVTGLNDLGDNTLLFLTNIQTIEYKILFDLQGTIKRVEKPNGHLEIHANRSNGNNSVSHWLRFQKDVEILDDDEITKKCRIAIAYSLEAGDEKKDKTQWKIVPLKHGQVSIYFPAEKETSNLRFHIHAPFASTVARDSVRACQANYRLRDEVAYLVSESLSSIRDAGMLSVNFLATLPVPSDNLGQFYERIRNEVVKCFCTKPLTPVKFGGHLPGEKLIRGPSKISEMFSDDDLVAITGAQNIKWVANPPQLNQRIDQFLNSLNIKTWGWDELEDYLYTDMSDFLDKKDTQWLKDLYIFLHDAMAREDLSGVLCNDWELLRFDECDYKTGKECFFPSSLHFSDQITFLPEELLVYKPDSKQAVLRDFYSKIGVKVLGEREELELILKEYYSSNTLLISTDVHLKHIERLIKFWKLNGNALSTVLKKTNILLSNVLNTFLNPPTRLFIDEPFQDTGLNALFADKSLKLETIKLPLWHGYAEIANFKEFAIEIGVMSALEIRHHSATAMQSEIFGRKGSHTNTTINNDFYINSLNSGGTYWHNKSSDYYLGPINLLTKSKALSLAIWKTVSNVKPEYLIAHYRPNEKRRHEEKKDISFFVRQLKESPWIPDKDGNFRKPADLNINDLHPDFVFTNSNGWLTKVGFGENEAKKTEEYRKKAQLIEESVGLSPEEAAELKDVLKDLSPEKRRELINRFKAEHLSAEEPELPSSSASDPERRELKSKEAAKDATDKEYESKNRSVRTTNSPERKAYLKNHNSTENGHVYCQLCDCRMPFMVKGEDYFEAVEFVRSSRKEYPENSLALCPNCAAEYKHACSTPENERIDLLLAVDINLPEEELKVNIELPNHTYLRFTQKHMIDLRAVMMLHRESIEFEAESTDEANNEHSFVRIQSDVKNELDRNIQQQHVTIISTKISDGRVVKAISGTEQLYSTEKAAIISKISDIIVSLFKCDDFSSLLAHEGIHVTTLKMAVDYLLPKLNIQQFGFSKYPQFIDYVCKTTGCASLFFKKPADFRISKRTTPFPGYVKFDSNYVPPPSTNNSNHQTNQKTIQNKANVRTYIPPPPAPKPSVNRCKFCGSRAMAGSDVCYSCG